jgi:hemoglobin-like flavoprotein
VEETQKRLVQESWRKLVPEAERAAILFYTRLFEEDPELRSLFHGDMAEQGQRLMTMLGTAIDELDKLEALAPTIRELGKHHAAFGVKPEHYETFADALMWTLQTVLGADFYPEVEEAWSALYDFMAETMKQGAGEDSQ